MGDNIVVVGPMCAESDGEKFTWWHFHCKEMMGLELLWEGAMWRWWNMWESSLGGLFTGTEGGNEDSFQERAAASIGRR